MKRKRRDALKLVGVTLPVVWSTPIVESVILPAHAQTTGLAPDLDPPIGPPTFGSGELSVSSGASFADVTNDVLALFSDPDTPVVVTFAGNSDGSCVIAVQFDMGSVRVSVAGSACSGSFQVVVEDSLGEATNLVTIPVTVV